MARESDIFSRIPFPAIPDALRPGSKPLTLVEAHEEAQKAFQRIELTAKSIGLPVSGIDRTVRPSITPPLQPQESTLTPPGPAVVDSSSLLS